MYGSGSPADIVKEIEHWQRSKLLPEQYCDFLLNLYAGRRAKPSAKLHLQVKQ